MSKKVAFVLAAILIVVGIGVFALQNILDPEPKPQCVAEGQEASGFTDPDQDDCTVSSESADEIADHRSKPRLFRIAGIALVVIGIGVGIFGLVAGRRTPPGDPRSGP